jgi:hypothetical protein
MMSGRTSVEQLSVSAAARKSRAKWILTAKAVMLVFVIGLLLQMMQGTINSLSNDSSRLEWKGVVETLLDKPFSSQSLSIMFENVWFLVDTAESTTPDSVLSGTALLNLLLIHSLASDSETI